MSSQVSWSQKSLTKAQRHFELKAFNLAIENAKEALELKPDCIECQFIVAESFRLMNQNIDAAIWYRKMEKYDELPSEYYLNYGFLMKKLGQYDKAKSYFELYKMQNEDLAVHYMESCEFAKAVLSEDIDFELNLYSASSKATDFGASIFKDKLVFASFRTDFKRSLEKLNKSLIQTPGPQLFVGGQGMNDDLNAVNFLLYDNEESYDMGPVHYAADASICTITKNNFQNGEQQIFSDDLELGLYLAKVEPDGSFNNIKAFPYNEVGYASGFGTLNASGNILYFASNRPGGHGGFDIYVSYFKNDSWTYPENLGAKINSPGNEVTPFFDGETLYYSSDYLKGLGGLDVFKSQVYNGNWQSPTNMGNGINSPEDDFYFIKHPEKSSYYLTSNRLGGRGSYDIYLVHKGETKKPVVEMTYEEVVPAEVNIDNELKDVNAKEAIVQTVSFDEDLESLKNDLLVEEAINEKVKTKNNQAALERIGVAKDLATEESTSKSELIDFNELLPPKAVDINSHNSRSVSLAGAKRISFGEVIRSNANVYFIQLAALFKTSGNIDIFIPLRQYGSIYKIKQAKAIKVKLGYFHDESQAKSILSEVRKMGYNDAFITFETLNTSQLELVEVSEKTVQNYAMNGFPTDETTGVNFKVRLASYEDPIWFDANSVKDVGIIEQWSKDQWTIFILGGYNSLEQAEKAKLIVQNRGFRDAEIVLDRNGILERFK